MKQDYYHLKTKNVYTKTGEAINATNGVDGQKMIIYTRNDKTFVREENEFFDKFSPILGTLRK